MTTDQPITVFLCGPIKDCEHDYSRYEPLTDCDGNERGITAVCVKCGQHAIDEDMWL